jgi:peptidoglycan/LPS O-acetylase OafA/YrhL
MNAVNTNTRAPGKPLRLEHIDGLRALAAVYVVAHHILLYVNDGLPLGRLRKLTDVFLMGHWAVDVFIVISGFCLMLPVIRNGGVISGGTLNFIRKRARRILPPYFSVLVLSLILIWLFIGKPSGSMWNNSIPVTGAGLLAHLFLVQDWFGATNHQINYSLWSISVEWRIYFLFPFLIYCWKRFGPLPTVAVTTVVSSLLVIPLGYTFIDTTASGVSPQYYGLFTFGMLAAGFAYSDEPLLLRLRASLPWMLLFLISGVAALTVNKGYIHQFRLPGTVQDLLVGCATLCLLVAVTPGEHSDSWHWVRNALGCAPLAFIGSFSYSLYLIHAPLLEVIWVYFVHPLHMTALNSLVLLASAGMAVVIGLAYLFFLLCERPFMGRPGGPGAARRNSVEIAATEAAAAAQ